MSQQKQRFVELLEELFQLNQPELDFGLYRILHARSQEIRGFMSGELATEIDQAFAGQAVQSAHELVQAARQKVLDDLADDAFDAAGELKPEYRNTKIGKDYLQAQQAAREGGGPLSDQAQVYDHLYRFFSRYYDKGDFMSKRYFVAENDQRAAPYAVPYDGREVMLHWANKDQYYIKSSEHLSNYSFDLTEALRLEAKRQGKGQELDFGGEAGLGPMKVHFHLAAATEGEHNNVKESQDRFFLIHAAEPIKFETDSQSHVELVVQFEYRPDNEKPPKAHKDTWQQQRLLEAAEAVLQALQTATPSEAKAQVYARGLASLSPTEKRPDRTVLTKYMAQFADRNTMDYFIHKDLGGFLRRELDFYIKNEVMRLDDIESAQAPRVEAYLGKLRVLRKIARRVVDFLAQLENFQRKLWLKKKFVVSTEYFLTLDRVPKKFHEEIAANASQVLEWQEIYGEQKSVDALLKEAHLGVDTKHFSADFKDRLLSEIHDLDEEVDGLAIQGDNHQVLNLMQTKFTNLVDCIYIDPPYNTGKDDFPYKDGYRSSSWATMINERVSASYSFLKKSGGIFVSCDENEQARLTLILDSIFGATNQISHFAWQTDGNFDNQAKVKVAHESVLMYAKHEPSFASPPVVEPGLDSSSKVFNSTIRNTIVKNGPKNPVLEIHIPAGFPCDFEEGSIPATRVGKTEWPVFSEDVLVKDSRVVKAVIARSGWSSKDQCIQFIDNNFQPIPDQKGQSTRFVLTKTGAIESIKNRSSDAGYVTSIIKAVGTTQSMSAFIEDAGLLYPFFPKPVGLIEYLPKMIKGCKYVLDYFAGSGTTAHAVINHNRQNEKKWKYIIAEQAEYFSTLVIPRIKKVTYSGAWKEKRPTDRKGVSHILKYQQIESFEDTLNNLSLQATEAMAVVGQNLPTHLKREYLLKYWLSFETANSPSLLNVQQFIDPTAYVLTIKQPGTDAQVQKCVDLVETFNWLIGLHVTLLDKPRQYAIDLRQEADPELPGDQGTRWVHTDIDEVDRGEFWFRMVEGHVFTVPGDELSRERVLVIWRKLTGVPGRDQAALEAWLSKMKINPRDTDFATIYVNGSHALNTDGSAGTRVCMIEETFAQRMWEDC